MPPGVTHELDVRVEHMEVLRAVVVVVRHILGQETQQVLYQLTEVLVCLTTENISGEFMGSDVVFCCI